METVKALENLFDKKVLHILKLFLAKKEQTFYLQEVAKQCRVPIASTYRIVKRLTDLQILKITRFKHWKTYGLDDNDFTKYLETMFEEKHTVIDEFVVAVAGLPEVGRVIELVGSDPKERKYKINVLVLGEGVPSDKVKEIVGTIKEKHNFTIVQTTLAYEQYEQLASMGLYTMKKNVLFER